MIADMSGYVHRKSNAELEAKRVVAEKRAQARVRRLEKAKAEVGAL